MYYQKPILTAIALLFLCAGLIGCPEPPKAAFTADPRTGATPLPVQFTDTSSAGSAAISARLWDFGDGATSTAANPSHTYTVSGPYTVSLTVTSSAGSDTENKFRYIVAETATEDTIMLPGDVPLTMVRISAGTFMMGADLDEQDRDINETPKHQVTLSHDFWIGKYELTKGQWKAIMATEPWKNYDSYISDPDSPAIAVTWEDAQDFFTELSTYTGQTYRLPTEAEWEYACRANTETRFYWGDDPDYTEITDYVWWGVNARGIGEEYAHVGGLKLPNAWGLYDMSGNVWEWCQDWFGYYSTDPVTDPTGPATGTLRILRAGSWYNQYSRCCRSAFRNYFAPTTVCTDFGFRVCRPGT